MLGYGLMAGVFRSSGRRSNPMGVVSVLAGAAAAIASAVLWIYRVEPGSQILGQYSAEVAAGGQLAEQLTALAAVLGLMAVLGSILTSSSGEGGGGYFVGLVLGLGGLSYPLLTWLDVISGPLRPTFP
jgi:hypothetical protein